MGDRFESPGLRIEEMGTDEVLNYAQELVKLEPIMAAANNERGLGRLVSDYEKANSYFERSMKSSGEYWGTQPLSLFEKGGSIEGYVLRPEASLEDLTSFELKMYKKYRQRVDKIAARRELLASRGIIAFDELYNQLGGDEAVVARIEAAEERISSFHMGINLATSPGDLEEDYATKPLADSYLEDADLAPYSEFLPASRVDLKPMEFQYRPNVIGREPTGLSRGLLVVYLRALYEKLQHLEAKYVEAKSFDDRRALFADMAYDEVLSKYNVPHPNVLVPAKRKAFWSDVANLRKQMHEGLVDGESLAKGGDSD